MRRAGGASVVLGRRWAASQWAVRPPVRAGGHHSVPATEGDTLASEGREQQ